MTKIVPTTFTIDRSKWRCGWYAYDPGFGHGKGETLLLNSEGYMCCLGHIALQCGYSENEIKTKGMPRSITNCHLQIDNVLIRENLDDYDGLYTDNTDFAKKAQTINDNDELTLYQKERALERLAEEYGLRIEFVGKYEHEEE